VLISAPLLRTGCTAYGKGTAHCSPDSALAHYALESRWHPRDDLEGSIFRIGILVHSRLPVRSD